MRILIFLLALMSAFFVSADVLDNLYDMNDLKQPKSDGLEICMSAFGNEGCGSDLQKAFDNSCAAYNQVYELPTSTPDRQFTKSECETGKYQPKIKVYAISRCPDCQGGWSSEQVSRYQSVNYSNQYERKNWYCPPEGFPEHKNSVTLEPLPTDPLAPTFMCAKLKNPECPAGHHSRAVSKALGSSECLPKECPQAGMGENLASTPMTGGVPFSGGGMYCNDGCAYSVSADQISSDKYAVGTSQGAACGDKPYDNKKLADEGETGECSVSTGDVPLLTCPNANPTTPDKDPVDNDDSKVPEDETPEKPKETCAEGDAACNLKNVETEIENSTNKQIDNDNELHNKKIDADTKNTNAILNALESIDTSILLQTQQDDRLHAVTVSKFNELVDAVNGIETGGSGGGGGGNGSGTGGDCEGSPSECVPVEGAEIPTETVNLNQYADKYDDWLPNAELPSEKCIVISTGRSLCFSFDSFILLFQSISGLIVIASLMHSARIISGAI